MTRLASGVLVALLLASLPSHAFAQGKGQGLELQQMEGEGLAPNTTGAWNVTLGLGIADVPVYPGASSHRVRLAPLFAVSYDNLVLLSPFGLAIKVIRLDGFFAGPVLGYQGDRREADDLHLAGLGDIPSSITGGVFAGYRLGPWEALVTVRQALTHSSNGLEGLLDVNYRIALVPHRMSLTIGPQLTFGDAEYNRTWFGISAPQAVNSGLPAYAPNGGLDSYGLHASFTSVLGEHVIFHAFAELRRLTSDLAGSPIVERPTGGSIGLGIAYHF